MGMFTFEVFVRETKRMCLTGLITLQDGGLNTVRDVIANQSSSSWLKFQGIETKSFEIDLD